MFSPDFLRLLTGPPHESHNPSSRPRHPPPPPNQHPPQSPSRTKRSHPPRNHPYPPSHLRRNRSHHQRPPPRPNGDRLSPLQKQFRYAHRNLPRRRPTPRHRRRPKKSRLVFFARFRTSRRPLRTPQRRRNQQHRSAGHAPVPRRTSSPGYLSRSIPRILPPTSLHPPTPTSRPPHFRSRLCHSERSEAPWHHLGRTNNR